MNIKTSNAAILDILNAKFYDKYDPELESFDIVIPIKNTNAFFYENLCSIYRNIPVNRLLIGDAGCSDNSLEVLQSFPRVEVFDHRHFVTQGVCIKDLIMRVQTKHFFYLHADIFIQDQTCVDTLIDKRDQAEWIEGFRKHITINEAVPENYFGDERSYSGMQLGETSLLQKSVSDIVDGDLQRNEDIVIAELVKKNGGIFKKVKESSHLHQIMNKDCTHEPILTNVSVVREEDALWMVQIATVHIRGIVKHLAPKPYLVIEIQKQLLELLKSGHFHTVSSELAELGKRYPEWQKYIYGGLKIKVHILMPLRFPRLYFKYILSRVRK